MQQFKPVLLKGNIDEGCLHGIGERHIDNAIIESGQFIRGKLNGTGQIENRITGTTEKGRFKDGVLKRSTDK